jgi:hypothetical protein
VLSLKLLLKWLQLRLPHHHYCRADVAAGWLLLLHGAVAGNDIARPTIADVEAKEMLRVDVEAQEAAAYK